MQTFAQNPKLNECIEACQETHDEALRTLSLITSEGSENATPEFVRLVIDCAEITQTAANFMLRGSVLHQETCKACEEVCEVVYEACEASSLDDIEDFKENVRVCVDLCREIATAGGRRSSEETIGGREGRGGRAESTRSNVPTKPGSESKGRGRTTSPGRGAR